MIDKHKGVLALLEYSKSKVDAPEKWCKIYYTNKAKKNRVGRCCVIGGIYNGRRYLLEVMPSTSDNCLEIATLFPIVISYLILALPKDFRLAAADMPQAEGIRQITQVLELFNDYKFTKHSDIIALYDRAIKMASDDEFADKLRRKIAAADDAALIKQNGLGL